ncbi:hypothetical protein AB4212_70645, partial [Streptomyces sp. 2MCAF27]
VDGGRPIWFERPNAVSGTRRVQLRLSALRDTTRPAEHTRRLPDVNQLGFSSSESGGGRQRGNALGGAFGAGGGFNVPLAGGAGTLSTGTDYTGSGQITDTVSVGGVTGFEQFVMTTKNGSEVFQVPARLGLDWYEGTDDQPLIRFADLVTEGDTEGDPQGDPQGDTDAGDGA